MPDIDKVLKDFFAKMKWTAKLVQEGIYVFQKDGKTMTLALAGGSGSVEIHRRVFINNAPKPDQFQKQITVWTARASALENIDPEKFEFNLNFLGFNMQAPDTTGRVGLILMYKLGDMGDLKRATESEQDFIGYCDFLTEFAQAVEEVQKAG